MSKTIEKYIRANPDKFIRYWNEDNNERGLDYWVECREPYFCPYTETPTIHEDTVKDTLAAMRAVVRGKFNGYCWEVEEGK